MYGKRRRQSARMICKWNHSHRLSNCQCNRSTGAGRMMKTPGPARRKSTEPKSLDCAGIFTRSPMPALTKMSLSSSFSLSFLHLVGSLSCQCPPAQPRAVGTGHECQQPGHWRGAQGPDQGQNRPGAAGSLRGLFVLTNNVPDSVLALTAQLRHVSLSEIIEARHPVELQLALLAAERATQADFAALRSCIDQLRGHRHSDLSIRIRYDHMFHYTLGRIARSSALALFQHQILEQIFLRMPDYFLYEENPDTVITLHEGTLAAIRSRSPEKIRAAIAEHMSALENVVTSSGGRPRSLNKP